jgi:cytochrome c
MGAAAAGLLLALSGQGTALAQKGPDLFTSKGCPACHGPDGKKSLLPTYPRLAGQNAPYLVLAMKAYRAQDRKGEQAMVMWGMAAQLKDAEMEQVADFLSKVQ